MSDQNQQETTTTTTPKEGGIRDGRGSYPVTYRVKEQKFFGAPSKQFKQKERDPQEAIEKRAAKEAIKTAHLDRMNEFYLANKHLLAEDHFTRLAKTPVVMLFAYIGTGYHGLEYTSIAQFPALENDLEKALFKAGTILPTNLGDLTRLRWNRSSRTDKGVHSLSTLLAGSLEMDRSKLNDSKGIAEYCDRINAGLPPNLRVLSIAPTTRTFDPRRQCYSRTYHYALPRRCIGTRMSVAEINEKILPLFIGTNSYHNFTSKRKTYKAVKPKDHDDVEEEEDEMSSGEEEGTLTPIQRQNSIHVIDRDLEVTAYRTNSQNVRKINTFTLGDRFKVAGHEDDEWLTFEIEGESFIQYQIRKMIGFVLSIANGHTDTRMLELALKSPFSIRSPVAPPNPLYLYDCEVKERISTERMDLFSRTPQVPLAKQEFCQNVLYPHLRQMDENDHFFALFMSELMPQHRFGTEGEDLDKLFEMYQQFIIKQTQRRADRQEKFADADNMSKNSKFNLNKKQRKENDNNTVVDAKEQSDNVVDKQEDVSTTPSPVIN
eukprot:gene13695-16137_t